MCGEQERVCFLLTDQETGVKCCVADTGIGGTVVIYTVTMNPALDKTVEIPGFSVDQVNRIQSVRMDPGGKGINVSKVIQKLGGQSIALGILGGNTGKKIEEAIMKIGIASEFTFVPGETRTNLKIVDREKGTNTDLNEPGLQVNPQIADEILTSLEKKIQSGDIVVISGSIPQGITPACYETWTRRLKMVGAKVFIDADGPLLAQAVHAAPYLIKPNADELARLAGRPMDTQMDLLAMIEQLLKEGIEMVVVSQGSQGAIYATRNMIIQAEGLKVPVGSTVGAGDSMVAAMAFACEKRMGLEETIRLSMATGAANVMCSGSQAAEYADIERLLGQVSFQVIT